MTNNTIKTMNKNTLSIKTSYNRYKELVQDNIEVFLRNYDTTLNRNSAPLQKMFEVIKEVAPKDLYVIKQYMRKVSNITSFNTNDKGNLTLSIDGDSIVINDKIEKAWYEVEVKQVIVDDMFKDSSKMISAFNTFYNKLVKSAEKLNITEKTLKDIENLKTQLQAYKA